MEEETAPDRTRFSTRSLYISDRAQRASPLPSYNKRRKKHGQKPAQPSASVHHGTASALYHPLHPPPSPPFLTYASSPSFISLPPLLSLSHTHALSSIVSVVVVVVIAVASGQATSFLVRSSFAFLLLLLRLLSLGSFLVLRVISFVLKGWLAPPSHYSERRRLPLGCSRCLSSFLPSPSPSAFINIHRRLIDGYDFLALPSGFSAIQPSGL